MSKRIAAVLATATVVAAATTPLPAFGASSRTVLVKGFAFRPAALTVKAGTKVTWRVGGDGTAHNITVRSGPVRFHSKSSARFTFTKRLTRKGTYRIVCTIHAGMRERIKVV